MFVTASSLALAALLSAVPARHQHVDSTPRIPAAARATVVSPASSASRPSALAAVRTTSATGRPAPILQRPEPHAADADSTAPQAVRIPLNSVARTPDSTRFETSTQPAAPISSNSALPSFVPAQRVRITDLAVLMLTNNPTLRASSAAVRAARERPSQAGALPDPRVGARLMSDVEQEGMVDNTGMVSFREERMTSTAVQYSQMIPLGKLAPMSRLESRMADRMQAEDGLERVMALRRLKESFVELYTVDASAQTIARIQDVLALMTRGTEAMYRSGQGRQPDILRAQLETSMLRDRLLMLEGRRAVAVASINALLARDASTVVGTPGDLEPYLPAATAPNPSTAPTVAVAQAGAEAATAGVDVARSMFIPDLELMGEVRLPAGRDPGWEVGAALTLPLWSASRQAPGLREAEARREEAEARATAAMLATARDAGSALAMARTAAAQNTLYTTTIIPQARLTLESSLAGYRTGGVDFMTVLANLSAVVNYELGAIESVATFYKSIAMYEEATGTTLEWRTP